MKRSLIAAALFATTAFANAADVPAADTTIVLVHGAFADGSSWDKVIPLLHAKGYRWWPCKIRSARWLTMLLPPGAWSMRKPARWYWSATRGAAP